MTRGKILVSACLMGSPVRYDGAARTLTDRALQNWQAQGRLVPICPEMAGGLGVPRPAAEIPHGRSGEDVWAGTARVLTAAGVDVTGPYLAGAKAALALAQANRCGFALLADDSPSCGSRTIHDGRFAGQTHAGVGVTTALLRANGLAVFSEGEIDALIAAVDS